MGYKINGVPVTREEFVNHKPGDQLPRQKASTARIGHWKALHCEALAYEPAELPMAKERDANLGAPDTDYDQHTGAPIFRGPEHYKSYLKAHGYVNRSSVKRHDHLTPAMLQQAIERVSQ